MSAHKHVSIISMYTAHNIHHKRLLFWHCHRG